MDEKKLRKKLTLNYKKKKKKNSHYNTFDFVYEVDDLLF